MLEVVDKLVTENQKLLPGEYGDLVRALKKVNKFTHQLYQPYTLSWCG